jgi:hypothetical protein
MKIRYVGARPREVAAQGHPPFTVGPGEEVNLPARLASSLLDQPKWFEKVAETPDRSEKPPVSSDKPENKGKASQSQPDNPDERNEP